MMTNRSPSVGSSMGRSSNISRNRSKSKTNDERNPKNELSTDFRVISICPTFGEILNNVRPSLRPNVVKGQYRSVDHYLNTHYQLLREDMVRSMRNGINEYKKVLKSGQKPQRIQDIRIYDNIRIGNRCEKPLTAFLAKSDSRRFATIDWRHSKRLIFGSLLCLSSNNFHTFCFASVAGDRNVENLSKGLFQLEFVSESLTEEFKHINPNTVFVMIESEVYFEAYKYNLLALKGFKSGNFPFKSYILDLKKTISRPIYINGKTVYDFSRMIDSTDQKVIDSYKSVKVMDSYQWPNAMIMSFDASQYQAFRTALLKEFVLIQGPPGTGKTYVGLKIVQTLHLNRQISTPNKPIVIICYTNHALDQFLEGMLPFCDNLVRIGGQSKSEILKDYTLSSIREEMKEKKIMFCPKDLNYKIAKCFENLENINYMLTQIDLEINNCRKDLLNLKYLYDMSPGFWFDNQMMSLLINYSNEFDLALIKWISKSGSNKSSNFESFNRFETLSDENDSFQSGFDGKGVVKEVAEEEVNREIESRATDQRIKDYLKTDFNVTKVKAFNTIFIRNHKSLNQISKRVQNQLKYEMISQLMSKDVMKYEEAIKITDVSQLSYSNRWRLYRLWINVYTNFKKKRYEKLSENFSYRLNDLKDLLLEKDMHLISSRDIIGLTTTGAAKFRSTLETINPKIVVIEEAAEVLESHVITSLTKSIEHLILIGDHKQLRPQTAVYELTQKYNLDVSLFERMIYNKMPFIQLNLQHRMRPEISKLLVPHIYRQLNDHKSVKNYEDVKGIKKNIYFVKHSQNESSNEERMSKSNEFEAEFIIRLAKHLIFQDYSKTQITILTLYSSQLILINRLLRRDPFFEGMRANIVDNFQGEENDIILLSFVRSNDKNDIGFLKTSNRVNVALSRAKIGLYCVGNFDCLSNGSKLWTNITEDLQNVCAIGPELRLWCCNHPKEVIKVSNTNDFDIKSPFGGCNQEIIAHDLDCGHPCPLNICHVSHKLIKCEVKCLKDLICGHPCPHYCHYPEECNDCYVMIEKTVPKCGHIIDEICSGNTFCYYSCDKTLSCGHKCDLKCGEECQTQCVAKVDKYIPECGHTIVGKCSIPPVCDVRCGRPLLCGHECELMCSETCDTNKCTAFVRNTFEKCGHEVETFCYKDLSTMKCMTKVSLQLDCGHNYVLHCYQTKSFEKSANFCTEKCDQIMVCGHRCQGSCIQCKQSRLHVNCQQKCERKLICGHECSGICGQNCLPCDQMCLNRCLHSSCNQFCSKPCIQCLKSCNWKCKHKKCTKRCFESCNREVCQMSCDKRLSCGHQCIGLCGELCPQFCLICQKPEINDIFGIEDMSDTEIMKSKFIELENCKHLIELKALETLLTTSDGNEDIFKRCPKCQTYITRCQPFNNIIKQQFCHLIEFINSKHCYNEQNKPKQKSLAEMVDRMLIQSLTYPIVRPIIAKIINDLKADTRFDWRRSLSSIKSKFQLSLIENKVIVIKTVLDVINELITNSSQVLKIFDITHVKQFYQRMKTFLTFICEEFMNTYQQIYDSERELRFYVIFSKLLILSTIDSKNSKNKSKELIETFDKTLKSGRFTQESENNFQSKVIEIIGENNGFKEIEIKLNPK